MDESLEKITENFEKLHRLRMIEVILKITHDFVYRAVCEIEEAYDNYEEFDNGATEIIIKNVKENLTMLDKYLDKMSNVELPEKE